MSPSLVLAKPTTVVGAVTFGTTIFFILLLSQPKNPPSPSSSSPSQSQDMIARSFILWLHGLGDSGPPNEVRIKSSFTSPEFVNTKWSFPSAPSQSVTCENGAVIPSWFDVHKLPVTASSPRDEKGVLKAVQSVHKIIDEEITAGTNPDNIFVCGFSQGGALTLASVLLYPRTIGGGAVFSGFVPFDSDTNIIEQIPPDAKKTPILWIHGMADEEVLFEAGQEGPPFLERAGVSWEFKAYPGLDHSVSTDGLSYLETWIKARLRSS